MIFSGIMGAFTAIKLAVKGFSLLKYVSPVLAGVSFFKDYVIKHWKISLIVALTLALVAGNWWRMRTIGKLEAKIVVYELSIQTYARVAAANTRSIERCVAVNRANAKGLLLAQFRADEAEIRARVLAEEKDKQVEKIDGEVKELRGRDEDCRSLDDPLPDWFDEWLRQ